ncbi:SDR family oxidoreductase [Nocardia cyriacigeorgica]|uniref:SDR family oxidoreductase n=1 Tax=Nocardia cyriacigeorgica TaxID=135487 RepID=UPI0013D060E2|nr:SDR family oxidoreductase [Nocardia cyriacigeorgica]MBF6440014.1 SDR family oxidoreductase [Nocardia cyriacigeorgica]MBF6456147.1 SDR family oxidoreductase [Nocardia cyriacigeorgica]MBF6477051.1 SDR family oxidoreductase [Nocardia cyriacigeorgica]MBF6553113.1 SDR family oxidoreductase [Nocardia cyriacigeorgica]NEW29481.1 SDR family oxidoreductase [Nocardia cyriacigeorgica]
MTKTAVVTGASSGIGRATARLLAERGYRVIGTSRNPDTIAEHDRIAGVEYRALDLTDPASIEAFGAGLGPVDVLVNNAGESQSGPIEELPLDAIERVFQVNVFGQVRLAQLVLPGMRARGYGRIIMVGSMLASFPLAYRSSYVAAKAALKGFADAARLETSPFGVWISTVEPGSISTGIGERRTKYIGEDSPYLADFHTMIDRLDRNERAGIPPEQVAALILRAIEAGTPKPLYATGSRAPLVFLLRRLLPGTVIEKVVARSHGLRR